MTFRKPYSQHGLGALLLRNRYLQDRLTREGSLFPHASIAPMCPVFLKLEPTALFWSWFLSAANGLKGQPQ